MAIDIYQDFAYARVLAPVNVGHTSLTVDDASRFPSNARLTKGVFNLTIDSGTQEIVRLTSVVGNTLNITAATKAHPAGVYVKGSITAEMMRNVRRAFYCLEALPEVDADLHEDGDAVFIPSTKAVYILYAGTWLQASSAGDASYKRYVDLGNAEIACSGGAYSGVAPFRGVSAGQSGGATVVAGIMASRGVSGATLVGTTSVAGSLQLGRGNSLASSGLALAVADLTVTLAPGEESSGVFGTQMFGEA